MRNARLLALLASSVAMTAPAFAADKESTVLVSMTTGDAMRYDVRVLGKLNVNTASREQLQSITALEPTDVEAILEARARGPIASLVAFNLSDEALDRLMVTGVSTLRRIRPLPLEVFAPSPASASSH